MDRRTVVLVVLTALIVGAFVYAATYNMLVLPWKYRAQSLARELAEKPVALTPANVKFNQTGGTVFNFSSAVASDGSVAATTTKELAIDIINEDTKPAKLVITLVNPKTGEKGLPRELQNAYVDVFVKFNGETKYLYTDNQFTNGKNITLEPASAISGYIGVTLKQAPAGTFADNQTYTITIYVVQPDANYVQSYTYTLKT